MKDFIPRGMKIKSFIWIFLFAEHILVSVLSTDLKNSSESKNDVQGILSPLMDYDQWRPLGRGDPLKNDPTYDYVPPVLDSVHYWVDPSKRKPDTVLPSGTKKSEVLLLGVSSKKPAISLAENRNDNFLKFVEGPKFNNRHQMLNKPQFSMPPYFSSFHQNKKDKDKNQVQTKKNDNTVLYTLLMPPPVATINPDIYNYNHEEVPLEPVKEVTHTVPSSTSATTTASKFTTTYIPTIKSTESDVIVQKSNLVYHSSSLLSKPLAWQNKPRPTTTISSVDSNKNKLFKTKIVKPNYNEKLVYSVNLQPPESYIRIEFSPHRNINRTNNHNLVAADSNLNINYVTAPPKLKVEGLKQLSSVATTSTTQRTTSTATTTTTEHVNSYRTPVYNNMMVNSVIRHPMVEYPKLPTPSELIIQQMETMQPPPITKLLQKETTFIQNYRTDPITVPTVVITTKTSTQPPFTTTEKFVPTALPVTVRETTIPPATTSTTNPTEPIVKNRNQAINDQPKRPLYLIIQGHSKVKTYGPTKEIHGIKIQETNEITDSDYSHKRSYQNYKEETNSTARKGRSGNLMNLKHVVQTRLGSLGFLRSDAKERNDIVEADFEIGYKVGPPVTNNTEKYYKGIVEAI